ncbi:UDP-N-acetylmuramoyl-tripeptide--D-alanyl-D-alanine ligase [Patescibacteria group bacterium]|nr:MAG: UDP-N-acetylmuramoyl-tripeptide--D-alanyl-D-alanine ligase [Patescibacteria group bacterium]
MKRLLSWILPIAPLSMAYMLQQFEYDTQKFAVWMLRYPSLWSVQRRGTFVSTGRGRMLRWSALGIYVVWILVVVVAAWGNPWYGLAILLSGLVTGYLLIILNAFMQICIVLPQQRREIARARQKLISMKDTKRIAVLGSYGKTSMKELLTTVLSEGLTVAATPGNKNVLISHARWIQRLAGDEDVLVIEYGEAAPGDIARFAEYSQPDYAVVTGLAPAHLDQYPSLASIARDFGAVQETVSSDNIWYNAHHELLRDVFADAHAYGETKLGDMKVTDIEIAVTGTSFTVKRGKATTRYTTGLLGAHHIGPLLAVIAIARELGLNEKQIQQGVAATIPYEHRMQPKSLLGAWIIDDAYNGNIEGMRAGLKLLMALPAKRRVYVTPGLVDQGVETEAVHRELGQLIGEAGPDRVVLMQNAQTAWIQAGIAETSYSGEVVVEEDPLAYYTGLEHHIAAGDVVMLQNDLPDAYA